MKTKKFRILTQIFFLGALISLFTFTACDEEDDAAKDPVASFQYEVSETNALEVIFTNYSQNAISYAWNFGDGESSTEENPTHVFAEGTFTVTLTATNADGKTDDISKDITIIADPQALLTGGSSKIWKLIRTGDAMGVGPDAANYTQWWALQNNGKRPCVFNQTWTFNADGSMDFDDGGYMWGDGVVFATESDYFETCIAASNFTVNKDGADITDWLSGTHQFTYDAAAGTLTLDGTGAWLGLVSKSPGGDVAVPQASLTYDVTITEGTEYDLMEVSLTGEGWYWQFNYVSYHDWANEPDVVSFMVDFTFTVDDFVVTFENKSADAVSYSWDFGDGNTSTEENPTHTYAAEGSYDVVLTGTAADASTKEITKTVTISLNPTVLAPTPTEPEANVISIYSDAYTAISGVNLDPDWGQATVTQEIDVLSEKVLKMAGLTYQGIDWAGNVQNVSSKTKLHVDIYCSVVTNINLSVIGAGENPVTLTTEAGVWKSFDILLSEYTTPDLTQVIQVKFDDAGTGTTPTIFVDNIYFY